MATLVVVLLVSNASAADYEVKTQPGLVYVEHDGTKLAGDFYLPKDRAKTPTVIALHGGGWQAGSRAFYNYWGPFLARNGYALFAVDYRLAKQGAHIPPPCTTPKRRFSSCGQRPPSSTSTQTASR